MSAEAHYEYRCEDHSILLRVLKEPVFMPLVRAVPQGITPNQVTVAGHVAIWLSFAFVLMTPAANSTLCTALALAHAFYVVSDCIDGMLARHSGRMSRLGELLDHGLDSVSIPLVVLGFGIVTRQPNWVLLTSTGVVGFMNFATLMHGYRVGYVHLGAIGIIEGILTAALLCLFAAIFGLEPLVRPLVAGVSISGWLLIALPAGGLTALISMRGLARKPADFAALTLTFGIIIAWYFTGRLNVVWTALLLLSASAHQACTITRARLLRRPLVLTDFVSLGTLILFAAVSQTALASSSWQTPCAAMALAGLLLQAGRVFGETVKALSSFQNACPAT